MRDGTADPVSRDEILRHVRGQGNIHFPCSADHEQNWQPYTVDPYSAICDDHHHCTDQPINLFFNVVEVSACFWTVSGQSGAELPIFICP